MGEAASPGAEALGPPAREASGPGAEASGASAVSGTVTGDGYGGGSHSASDLGVDGEESQPPRRRRT
eukprot:14242365-Alexandrium_andersonii.AAC.1